MQAVIVNPLAVDEAVRSRSATRHMSASDARRAILPSKTLMPLDRLAVYQGMYPLRMRDALAADYPGVSAFLGHARFAAFVNAYVGVHPSRSYTFARLGDNVPEFLARSRRFSPADFLSDLARLERTIGHVFDLDEERGSPPPSAHRDRRESDDWETRRFVVSPTLRLLSFRHAAGPALDALKAGARPNTRPRAAWSAVHRRRYSVIRIDLGRAEFHLLSALATGRPLGSALRDAARRNGKPLSAPAVLRAFRTFTAQRLLLDA